MIIYNTIPKINDIPTVRDNPEYVYGTEKDPFRMAYIRNVEDKRIFGSYGYVYTKTRKNFFYFKTKDGHLYIQLMR